MRRREQWSPLEDIPLLEVDSPSYTRIIKPPHRTTTQSPPFCARHKMAPRNKTGARASRIGSEFATPASAPCFAPHSSTDTAKRTASPDNTTYCQYLGCLVTKLDRVARVPKLIVESAKSMSDVMLKPGPRQSVVTIRALAGFLSIVPHILWMGFLFASVMYFGLPWMSLLYFVLIHQWIVFLDMVLFPLRGSKQHKEKILIVTVQREALRAFW